MWKKGESGNPGGRRKDPLLELIRKESKDGAVLVKKAFKLLESDNEEIQMKALAWLGDRGFYKARQPLDVGDANGEPLVVKIVNYAGS